jgi:NAD(P)-dependent dehydrogenase (short-subunit alcohol dehydrogenase family)
MSITNCAGIPGMSSFPSNSSHETYLYVAADYNSTKCATVTFTHSPSLAKQLSNEGIKANAIALYAMKNQYTDNQ